MWTCLKCHEQVEENFEVCWNCGSAKDGTEDPSFRVDDSVTQAHYDRSVGQAIPVAYDRVMGRAVGIVVCVFAAGLLLPLAVWQWQDNHPVWAAMTGLVGVSFLWDLWRLIVRGGHRADSAPKNS